MAIDTTAEAPELTEAHGLARALRAATGLEFSVWRRGAGWTPVDDGEVPVVADDLAERIEAAWGGDATVASRVRLTRCGDSTTCDEWAVIAVPADDDVPTALVGRLPEGEPALWQRLLEQSVARYTAERRLAELSTLVDGYAAQVSTDFEELTFLRRLARHVEFSDVTRQIRSVAAAALTELRDIVRAESLVFLVADVDDQSSSGPGPDLVVSGPQVERVGLYWKAVEAVRGTLRGNTCVWNHTQDPGRRAPPAVACLARSLIVTHVAKDGVTYGWLLALNKRPPSLRSDRPSSAEVIELSADEFGTIEASLLEATATLLATHASNVRRFQRQESLTKGVVRTLVQVIELRDKNTCGHSDRVALVARRLARQLGMDEVACESVFLAGLLHDIGKVGLADDVLLKPGQLSTIEYARVMEHPIRGYQLLKNIAPLKSILPGVLYHHEAFDGTGYPYRLRGSSIPLIARVIAVADAYDAMTSDRPYRQGMGPEKAHAILAEGAGKRWDARIVAAFLGIRQEIIELCTDWSEHMQQVLTPFADSGDEPGEENSDQILKAVKQSCEM